MMLEVGPHSPSKFVAGSLVVLAFLCVYAHQGAAETTVREMIARDTLWSMDNSPYLVAADVTVVTGASLSIEPGVVIKFAPETTLKIDGLLIARGIETQPITFTSASAEVWGHLEFSDFSDDAVLDKDLNYISGSVLEHCIVERGKGIFILYGSPLIANCTIRRNESSGIRVEFGAPTIRDNLFYENSTESDPASGNGAGIIAFTDKTMVIVGNVLKNNRSVDGRYGGGGICAYAYDKGFIEIKGNAVLNNYSSTHAGGIFAYRCLVEDNLVVENRCDLRGGGINAIECTVTGNLVDSNQAAGGGGVYAENSELRSNSIVNNRAESSYGGGIYFFGSGSLRYNTVIYNTTGHDSRSGGIYVSGNPKINYNTLCRNEGFGLYTGNPTHSPVLDMGHNFWGVLGDDAIIPAIHDWYKDASRGLVDYSDYLAAAPSEAPLSPPVGLRVSSGVKGLHLEWDPSPDAGSTGYAVHYGTAPDDLYDGAVDVGDTTSYDITGITQGTTYFVAVSARRAQGEKRSEQSALSERLKISVTETVRKPPDRPINLSPARGESGVSLIPMLGATPFSEAIGTGHTASRWQMTQVAGDYSRAVFDSGPSAGATMGSGVPEGVLRNGKTYFWRVSYCGEQGDWSAWSAETAFTTSKKAPSVLSGPLRGEVTWSREGSPYVLTGNTLVVEGATLTLEPGVTVRIDPGASLMVHGKISALGTAEQPVTFTKNGDGPWGQLIFADPCADAVFDEDGAYRDGSILKHCVVEHGSGILIEGASPFITDSVIRFHQASGLTIRKGGPTIARNRIVGNKSDREGGGIYIYTNDLTKIRGNVVRDNTAQADGGGIFAYGYRSSTSILILDNEIAANVCAGNGGGVYVSRATLAGNALDNNRASELGGGVYTTFSIVERNRVDGNTAYQGGGIFSERNSTIRNNWVTGNSSSSPYGGGVYINYWGASFENEVFSYNHVTRNEAASAQNNGGVYVSGVLFFEENDIFDNAGYELYNSNGVDLPVLEAKECYWGTDSADVIESEIFHHVDDDSLGTVSFTPFAGEMRNLGSEDMKALSER